MKVAKSDLLIRLVLSKRAKRMDGKNSQGEHEDKTEKESERVWQRGKRIVEREKRVLYNLLRHAHSSPLASHHHHDENTHCYYYYYCYCYYALTPALPSYFQPYNSLVL